MPDSSGWERPIASKARPQGKFNDARWPGVGGCWSHGGVGDAQVGGPGGGGGGPAGGDGAQRQLHVQKHPGALALRNQVGARPPLHRQEGVHHLLVQPVELLLGPRPASVPRPVPTSPPHGNHTVRGDPRPHSDGRIEAVGRCAPKRRCRVRRTNPLGPWVGSNKYPAGVPQFQKGGGADVVYHLLGRTAIELVFRPHSFCFFF